MAAFDYCLHNQLKFHNLMEGAEVYPSNRQKTAKYELVFVLRIITGKTLPQIKPKH